LLRNLLLRGHRWWEKVHLGVVVELRQLRLLLHLLRLKELLGLHDWSGRRKCVVRDVWHEREALAVADSWDGDLLELLLRGHWDVDHGWLQVGHLRRGSVDYLLLL